MRHYVLHSWVRICACAALLFGCSRQQEGERCDTANGNLDCATGLVCLDATQISILDKGAGVALCCPPAGTAATTVDACRAGTQLPPDQGFVPQPDAGAADAAPTSPEAADGGP